MGSNTVWSQTAETVLFFLVVWTVLGITRGQRGRYWAFVLAAVVVQTFAVLLFNPETGLITAALYTRYGDRLWLLLVGLPILIGLAILLPAYVVSRGFDSQAVPRLRASSRGETLAVTIGLWLVTVPLMVRIAYGHFVLSNTVVLYIGMLPGLLWVFWKRVWREKGPT